MVDFTRQYFLEETTDGTNVQALVHAAQNGVGPSYFPPVQVKSVFIVHVGGTRGVPSSTDHSMKIHVRITWTVEVIRTCICLFLFYVEIQGRV